MRARPLNIVLVSREYGPITGGGIGTYVHNVTTLLLDRGHAVTLVTDCVDSAGCNLLAKGLHVVPTLPLEPEMECAFACFLHEYSYRVYKTLQRLCAQSPVDLVEFPEYNGEGFVSIQAKRTLGLFESVRLLVKLHTPTAMLEILGDFNHPTSEKEMIKAMEAYSLRNADGVCSPTESLAKWSEQHFGIARPSVVENPFALPTKFGENRERDPGKVLFAGTLQPRKGVDNFVRASLLVLEKVPTAQIHLAGRDTNTGPFERSYQRTLQRLIPDHLAGNFVWHGSLKKEQLDGLYATAGVVVFPSRWENFPNVCLESMIAGTPTIGSRSGGMAEIIVDGASGLLVDPGDPRDIAEKILKVIEDPGLAARLSQAGKSRVQELIDPKFLVKKIEYFYREQGPSNGIAFDTKDSPKVSVVIPLYNQGLYLAATLESLKKSTYKNLEIVVVNDGSTDPSTLEIFNRLSGVKKISQKNRGLGGARNTGINASNGKYILPLDSDDLVAPDLIEKCVRVLEQHKSLGYVGVYTRYFENSSQALASIGFIDNLSYIVNTEGSCTKLFRRELFDAETCYDESLIAYEDWDLQLKLHRRGVQGDIIPEALFLYRRRDNSMNFVDGFMKSPQLLQYIIENNAKGLPQESRELMQLLSVELWKTHEIARAKNASFVWNAEQQLWKERSEFERALGFEIPPMATTAQVFWDGEGAFAESESDVRRVFFGHWATLSFNIKKHKVNKHIRFDPSTDECLVRVRDIIVVDLYNGEVLFDVSDVADKQRLDVEGSMVLLDDALEIIAEAKDDPRFVIPLSRKPTGDIQVNVTFKLQDRSDRLLFTLGKRQGEARRIELVKAAGE
jgi:glycosyltransferase involved in cell wall biosynthesis